MAETKCPICDSPCLKISRSRNFEISCPVCSGEGKSYIVSASLVPLLRTKDDGTEPRDGDRGLVRYLSAAIRKHRGQPIVINGNNWRGLAEQVKSKSVASKFNTLLRAIESLSQYPGHKIEIKLSRDYPLADAVRPNELEFLLEQLHIAQLIHYDPTFYANVQLTAKGWEHLQPIVSSKGIPGRCFVAMSFSTTLDDAYDLAIEPALKSCGLDPRRVDKILDNMDINDKMIAELREAELVIADFTLQRPGVYFEAGFARGLGREVFWTCRKDEEPKLHFDTRQFNFIFWTTLQDLKTQLTDKIKALGYARN